MRSINKSKILIVFIAFIMPLAFYGYFEWKKHQTGFRIEELPFLSQQPIPDFTFTSQEGRSFNRSELNGKIVVADYFFTSCPGICKQMSGQMKRVEAFFSTSAKFKSDWLILSFTVDPETDTPATMVQYASNIGVKTGKWKFLTGTKDSLYHLATQFFKLPAIDLGTASAPEPFVHSERFVLLDKEGFIRGYYDGTDTLSVNKLMNDALLLDIYYTIQSGKEKKAQKKFK
jgi:protein SCO1/2